jgi:hypothetical protein
VKESAGAPSRTMALGRWASAVLHVDGDSMPASVSRIVVFFARERNWVLRVKAGARRIH